MSEAVRWTIKVSRETDLCGLLALKRYRNTVILTARALLGRLE